MLSKFFERIFLQNAFLGLPLLGSYPWGRVDAPQMSGCTLVSNETTERVVPELVAFFVELERN